MTHRAKPIRSTVTYGSLRQARPSRHGLQFTDRIAICPICHAARRIDLNETFYTHLSGEIHVYGSEKLWIECLGAGQTAALECFTSPANVPAALTTTIEETWDENLVRMRQLGDAMQLRSDHLLKTVPSIADIGADAMVQRYRNAIVIIKAENEFLNALLNF